MSPTADGQVVLVTLTGAQWAGLTAALLDDEGDGAMADTAERMKGGAEVMRRVRAAIADMPTDEVVARLRAADVPVAPVRQLDEVAHDPQVAASGTVRTLTHNVLGPIHQPRPAPLFDGDAIARRAGKKRKAPLPRGPTSIRHVKMTKLPLATGIGL